MKYKILIAEFRTGSPIQEMRSDYIRNMALANFDSDFMGTNIDDVCIHDAFRWTLSPQGHKFWKCLCDDIRSYRDGFVNWTEVEQNAKKRLDEVQGD